MDVVLSQRRCLRSLAAIALWSLGILAFYWLPVILAYRHGEYKDPIAVAACIGAAFLLFATMMTARSFLSFCDALDEVPGRRRYVLSAIAAVLLVPNVTGLRTILFALVYALAVIIYTRNGGLFIPPP
jgi:hypothetical protein